ncbi:hypothetical protein COV53_00885 [Candidatus Gottesmanbacteria bacterium CG11_big_fil_rev_8_21_14_0_20_37_11]|uniref:Chorismate mutase domain-containing protein n=2 Tax=Candidatus Gottesmaniibacteriota TaxID=1752720 RepID=A0A2M7RPT3_9BACT|nr:MAG: hypothetical protein COX23_05715 [Candidatus Gottesmanbacteria bacterium CG23_combo_of_CG06-09_8_20_14_all_37_19]PIR08838.1 MAG: hypothetical protein COV53_00885 [Candidatus Gottesmanbacteria bacterium CG11_big_fil_rev_8_21_14_0_20_37_11]PIZ02336.1 MAG: hypothetical protein COY59_05410 [Candidatus Gottesmanbacteria bacterium CG_4_10_14_0_8_um_filter_37_24]
MKLNIIRKKISIIDENIVKLLKRRMALSLEAKKEKNKTGLNMEDTNREKEILENVKNMAQLYSLDQEFVYRLFQVIINESKTIQKK